MLVIKLRPIPKREVMDEVEQDTSGFLPLVGITEVRYVAYICLYQIELRRVCR